ncbi:alpha/beta fold hydrolase [Austwickia chelonae]|uniref:alpha/beta fold hydrolase n=1 Tax=Austwickia chelonae TaxID=100225 RepID=UPI000E243B41|nr:alpha/beta hydrolase [Austwickia chelonae]
MSAMTGVCIVREMYVETPAGRIAVQDYGGSGVDVLLVHSLGFCGPQWRLLAESLAHQCRPLSLDLPGHGHTSVPLTEADDLWHVFVDVIEGAGLDRPVVVAHDLSVWPAMVAGIVHPELVRALVLVGGSMARTVEGGALLADAELRRTLAERFRVGATGRGVESARELQRELVDRVAEDWMLTGLESGFGAEIEHSIVFGSDGRWVNTPTVEAMENAFRFDESSPLAPSPELYAQLWVPTWLVGLSEGFDGNLLDAGRDLAERYPQISLRLLMSGQWPQYTAVDELAEVVASVLSQMAVSGGAADFR